MNTKTLLLSLQILLSALLIIFILLQVRGSGLGTVFGGGGGGEFYRSKRGVEKILYRGTIVLGVLFAANSIALAYMYT